MNIDNYDIIASLKGEPTCKLINRILNTRFMSQECMLSRWTSLAIQHAFLKPCLDIKRHSPSLYSQFIVLVFPDEIICTH